MRPLFRGYGWLVSLGLAVLLIAGVGLDPYVVMGVVFALFLGSFTVTWKGLSLAIRLRAYIVVIAALMAANKTLQAFLGGLAGNLVFWGVLLGLFIYGPTRRFLTRRIWCVLDRQRMRACFKVGKVRTMNLDGSLPLLLWARPTKTGERVWLWIRAGSSSEDIEASLSYIAPACYARDARIHRYRKLTTIVAVDIIRRDPLSANEKVPSPLSQLSEKVSGTVAGEGTETIRSVPVIEITEADWGSADPVLRKTRKSTTTPPVEPTRPTVIVSGEDLSDYVD
ncbi:hypothetical protein DMH04_50115 [Kibdelosporangium aridum]|uniref:Uncharacterized protein n=1 Tax=Kibdelosporangium aridum TaxID=2030 RepID=A0A428YBM2_KIBAR|nr:hypothetical protein DMH04_50115 [Kibdelosporangium aridum]